MKIKCEVLTIANKLDLPDGGFEKQIIKSEKPPSLYIIQTKTNTTCNIYQFTMRLFYLNSKTYLKVTIFIAPIKKKMKNQLCLISISITTSHQNKRTLMK
jgi:hypothetical protein